MAELHVVTGGTRSGKSEHAEAMLDPGDPVTYIATCRPPLDEELGARIAAHRLRRPTAWSTVESTDVAAAIAATSDDVLVDSVGTWVQARMDDEDLWDDGDLDHIVVEAAGWMARARGRVVVVAEQVGGGLIPTDRGTRRWVDLVGEVTAALVAEATSAVLVVAGRAIDLPGPDRTTDTGAGGAAPAAVVPGAGDPAEDGDRLDVHGDTMVPDGAIDLAVNVVPGPPPAHVRRALDAADVGRYPSPRETVEAVAGHVGLSADHVVLLAGAADGFWLLPHALRPRSAAVVHPMFTAPEAALRACDIPVTRVPRDRSDGWALRPDRVGEEAEMVVLGNPNNPTGTLDEPSTIVELCRDGRTVVVDEAFMDFVVDGRSSLAGLVGHEAVGGGLVVIRSATKMWSVPGVRAGYLLAAPAVAARLRAHQQPWPVSAGALAVITAAVTEEGWRIDTATGVARAREVMCRRLARIDGVTVHPGAANFILLEVGSGPAVHRGLLARGIAVRPSTFPSLPSTFLRVAVTDPDTTERLAAALGEVL